MKKKLLRTFMLAAFLLVGGSAWAQKDWAQIFEQDYENSETIATGWVSPNSRLSASQVIRSGDVHYGKINAGSTNGDTFTYSGLTNSGIVGSAYELVDDYKIEFDMAIIPTEGRSSSQAQTPTFTIYDYSNNSLCHWQVTTEAYTAAANSIGSFYLGTNATKSADFNANLSPYFYHITILAATGNATKMTVKDIGTETETEYTLSENFIRIGKFTYLSGKTQGGLCLDDLTVSINVEPYKTRASSAKTKYTDIKDYVMNTLVKASLDEAYTNLASYSDNEAIAEDVSGYVTSTIALETANANAQSSIDNFIIMNNLIEQANAANIEGYVAPKNGGSVVTENANINPVTVANNVRAAVIDAGTTNENTDISAIIANNSFGLGNSLGWTIDNTLSGEGINVTDGVLTIHPNGNTVSQTIGTLPVGRYRLSAKAWSNGAIIYLIMNDTHNTGKVIDGNNLDVSYDFTLSTKTEVAIGINSGDQFNGNAFVATGGAWWYRCDNFSLTYLGLDLATAKNALDAEIDAATTVKNSWTARIGTTPFKYNSTYYDALVTEISEATDVKNGGSETVSDYTTAKSELETAKDNITNSVMNLPAADKYYRLYLADEGVSTGNNLNMLEYGDGKTIISSTPYPVKFVASGDQYILENPYDYYIVTPKDNTSAWGAYKDLVEGETMEVAANKWNIEPQEDGTFKLLSEQASWKSWNWYLGTHSTDEGAIVSPFIRSLPKEEREATKTNWLCSEAVDLTDVNLSVNATAGWGTFIAPYDNLTPSTVKAYTVSYTDNNRIYFEEDITGVLNANTPYVLSTEEAENVSVALKGIATNGETTTYEVNGLVGLLAAQYVPADSYVLQYQAATDGTALYKLGSAMAGSVNRCYIDLSKVPTEASPARVFMSFPLFDNDVNAIKGIQSVSDTDDEVYNLKGQRVATPKSGLYIVNGKKVIIK